jgi:hypothetical protein
VGRIFNQDELVGGEPMWILEVTIGGRVDRFATEAVTIMDGATALDYEGTLTDVAFDSESDFGVVGFDIPSAEVAITFRDSLAQRIAQGADLGAATAELSLWIQGDDYDDRRVVVIGEIDAPSYGGLGEPVRLSIEPAWLSKRKQIPSATAVITTANFPAHDPNCKGKTYPIIIGACGREGFSGSPAYIIDDGAASAIVKLLIAGHPTVALTVDIERSNGAVYTKPILFRTDNHGHPYSYVELLGGEFTLGDTYWIRWSYGGGLPNPYRAINNDNFESYLTGGGDLVRWLLEQSGITIDQGRVIAVAEALNQYTFDGFIGERVDPLEFLESEIAPLLPMSLLTSPAGIYPMAWRYEATLAQARATMTADQDMFRDGVVNYEKNTVANEITIRFQYDVQTTDLGRVQTVTGDPSKPLGDLQWRNDYAAASFTRYGERSMALEATMVSRPSTAGKILGWLSRANAFRRRLVSYRAPIEWAWLDVGEVVAVTDQELFFDQQLMIIRKIEWGETDLGFEFLIIPDLPRDIMTTG